MSQCEGKDRNFVKSREDYDWIEQQQWATGRDRRTAQFAFHKKPYQQFNRCKFVCEALSIVLVVLTDFMVALEKMFQSKCHPNQDFLDSEIYGVGFLSICVGVVLVFCVVGNCCRCPSCGCDCSTDKEPEGNRLNDAWVTSCVEENPRPNCPRERGHDCQSSSTSDDPITDVELGGSRRSAPLAQLLLDEGI